MDLVCGAFINQSLPLPLGKSDVFSAKGAVSCLAWGIALRIQIAG
jgi:hypothetical protein